MSSNLISIGHANVVVGGHYPAEGFTHSPSRTTRASIDQVFTREDLMGLCSINIPSGYYVVMHGLETLTPTTTAGTYYDSGWLMSTINPITLPQDTRWEYFAFNFRREDNGAITASDITTLTDNVVLQALIDTSIFGNSLLFRRRLMSIKEKILDVNVELPDYWRFDFTTTEVDEHIIVGYYALTSAQYADLILDGTSNKSLGVNGSEAYVRIPTIGQHTMYLKINLPYSNQYYAVRPRKHAFDYVRMPYNWTMNTDFGGNNDSPKVTIDRLDIPVSNKGIRASSYYWLWHVNTLYVPKEDVSWYKAYNTNGSNSYIKSCDSIKGANFIYTTS